MAGMRSRACALVALLLVASSGAPAAGPHRAEQADGVRAAIDAGRSQPAGAKATVVVFVRHAEKRRDDDDPGLTRRGRRRAIRLADMLRDAGVDRLFASEYRRTRQTLEPLARRVGLDVEARPGGDVVGLADELRELPAGTLAVVAGHSNTVPALIRALGVDPGVDQLPEDAHDRLFVVTLAAAGGSAPNGVLELQYDP